MIRKKLIRRLMPTPLRKFLKSLLGSIDRAVAVRRSNAEVFERVYTRNLWGGKSGEFYSGTGSDGERSEAYVKAVAEFIESNSIREVVDIGCGDFRVGNALVKSSPIEKYIGVDVVAPLIERNRLKFTDNRIRFECLDATESALPPGELCLLRQVLQHLSNADINAILTKVRSMYRYVVITEHHPKITPLFTPNRDLVHGAAIRNLSHSGVYPHLPPFDFPEPEILIKTEAWNCPEEEIVTMLFRMR